MKKRNYRNFINPFQAKMLPEHPGTGIKQTRVPPKMVGFITDTWEQYFRIEKAELPQHINPFQAKNLPERPGTVI